MAHTIRRWVEFILVIAIIAGIVYLVKFKPSNFIKVPGTNTVINMKEATQDIQNRLKQLDTLAQQQKQMNDQLQQIIVQMNQNIKAAGQQKDVQGSVNTMKQHWGGQ
jgi:TolA-binding protein